MRSDYWQIGSRWLSSPEWAEQVANVELEFGDVFRLGSKQKRMVSLVGTETISSGFLHADWHLVESSSVMMKGRRFERGE